MIPRPAFTLVELPAVSPSAPLRTRDGKRSAFTLVELLVVITIIVVLLAMLTPALDKAIYQAELAVCGARLKAIGGGSIAGAVQYRRQYPARPTVAGQAEPSRIAAGNAGDLPVLESYLTSLDLLLCPLAGQVELDVARQTAEKSNVYAAYNLWIGYGYQGKKTMRKIGDRWTADDTPAGSEHSFSLLAGDYDWQWDANINRAVFGTHPDSNDLMINRVLQDDPHPNVRTGSVVTPEAANNKYTLTRWEQYAGGKRGAIDMNHAYEDGSVRRFDRVRRGRNLGPDEDEPRMVEVPPRVNNYATWGAFTFLLVPKE